jgi:hypothetical protein
LNPCDTMGERIGRIRKDFSFCFSVVHGSDAPTSCRITYATNFVNFSNLRNLERTLFSYIGGIFCVGSFLRNDKKKIRSYPPHPFSHRITKVPNTKPNYVSSVPMCLQLTHQSYITFNRFSMSINI